MLSAFSGTKKSGEARKPCPPTYTIAIAVLESRDGEFTISARDSMRRVRFCSSVNVGEEKEGFAQRIIPSRLSVATLTNTYQEPMYRYIEKRDIPSA